MNSQFSSKSRRQVFVAICSFYRYHIDIFYNLSSFEYHLDTYGNDEKYHLIANAANKYWELIEV